MPEKNIIVNGLNVHFYQSEELNCDGPVIFLHGWGSQASHLKSVFEKSENFIALDLPGFGMSERPSSVWTTAEYADFLRDFLLKLSISKPVLVGHSFGGSIIIKYCASHKDVEKIILIGSAGIRKKSSRLVMYKTGARIFNSLLSLPVLKKIKHYLRRKFYTFIGSEDYLDAGEMKDIFQKVINDDLTEELKRLDVETVMIWGEEDKETPISDANNMHELIRKSKLFVISGAGHYVFLDNKDAFNKIFFEQLP
ncbi:MAG: Alpha/beta hydrolase fold protein [uncultured bacterium]|nr:MAG: Alpha/beta hydrolase fold protein [uncultured bacterium]